MWKNGWCFFVGKSGGLWEYCKDGIAWHLNGRFWWYLASGDNGTKRNWD